jgi:hypothetical protein
MRRPCVERRALLAGEVIFLINPDDSAEAFDAAARIQRRGLPVMIIKTWYKPMSIGGPVAFAAGLFVRPCEKTTASDRQHALAAPRARGICSPRR